MAANSTSGMLMPSNITTDMPMVTEHPLVAHCRSHAEKTASFINYYTFASLIYLFLLSFRVPRKRLWPNCCWRLPGVIFPLDFLMDPTRRLAYSAVLIVFSGRIVEIYGGQDFWLPQVFYDDPTFNIRHPYVKVFITYIYVVQLSVCFYSLLMSIQLRRYFTANILGILFTIPWIYSTALYYVDFQKCMAVRTDEEMADDILADLPVWVSFAVLIVSYVQDLVKNIRHRRKTSLERGRHEAMPLDYRKVSPEYVTKLQGNVTRNTIYGKYVRALLKSRYDPNAPDWRKEYMTDGKKKRGMVTRNKTDIMTDTREFRYPLRIMATVCVALYVLSRIILMAFFIVKNIYDDYRAGAYDRMICMGLTYAGDVNCTRKDNTVRKAVGVFFYGWCASLIISLILHLLMVFHFILRYRKHVRRLLRGDWSFMPAGFECRDKALPEDIMALNMRFSGYYVAFLSYGFVVLTLAIQMIILLLAYGLVLPLTDNFTSVLVDRLKGIWPTLLITILISNIQKFSARYVFLQSREVLGVDNKRVYHVFEYFTFFFNAVYGFYVANRRLIYSMFSGALRIGRLDKLFLLKGFHNLDEGHKTYLSVLIMELYHNHPIVRSVVENLIFDSLLRMRDRGANLDINDVTERDAPPLPTKKSRAKLRWYKAYTLIRNPGLQPDYYKLKNPDKQNGMIMDIAVVGGPELGVTWKVDDDGMGYSTYL